MTELKGRTGFVNLGGYEVEFEIVDTESGSFGSAAVLVKPVAGYRRGWMRLDQLKLRALEEPEVLDFPRPAMRRKSA